MSQYFRGDGRGGRATSKRRQEVPKARSSRTLADFFHQPPPCPPAARLGTRQQEQLAARDADIIATENYMDQEVVLAAVLPRLEDSRPKALQIMVPEGRWLQAATTRADSHHTERKRPQMHAYAIQVRLNYSHHHPPV